MARPRSDAVAYFPHDAMPGRTSFIVEQHHKNDGYAFHQKLKEMLAAARGHVLDLSQDHIAEYVQARAGLSAEKCNAILDLLARIGCIDKALWAERRIVWMQELVDSVSDVYRKRKTEIPQKPSFCDRNNGTDNVSVSETLQSKEKKSKKNKTFLSDSNEVRLASMLWKSIQDRKPDAKAPDLQTWAAVVDKMCRIDNRSSDRIENVIAWCQADPFWQDNILSTTKLREHFDRLELKMGKNTVSNPRAELMAALKDVNNRSMPSMSPEAVATFNQLYVKTGLKWPVLQKMVSEGVDIFAIDSRLPGPEAGDARSTEPRIPNSSTPDRSPVPPGSEGTL